MKSRLHFRHFVVTAALVLVSFLIIGIAFVFLARGFVISEKKQSLYKNASEIERVAGAYALEEGLDSWELRLILSSIGQITDNRLLICDESGTVVSCSDMEVFCEHIGRSLPGEAVTSARGTGSYEGLTTLNGVFSETNYVVVMPITSRTGESLGYVLAASNSAGVVDAWNTFIRVYLFVALIIMVIALLLSYAASKHEVKPLKEMAAAAHRFAHGDFSIRVEDEGREDEIGELTRSFNAMADALEKADTRRSEFIANVSHELKTPMTTIAGFADGILDGTIPPEEQGKYLTTISSETKRLSRLVRSMLDLSRLDAADTQTLREKHFVINELLVRTLLNFEGKINERRLDVDVQLPEDDITVCGDSDAITRVVYNLLDNAVKFAREDSTIVLALWKQGPKAYVSVKDEGETIDPEELRLIFDRFHKTDRSRSQDRDGVGLGLYLVKTILNNHDEDISVTSEDGVTEFIFTLRLYEG